MKVGDTVLVFSASGTFRGESGRVVERTLVGARVLVEGERDPMLFTRRELVPVDDGSSSHVGGAE